MAKFHGKIGYAITAETTPGVWTEQVTERDYFGDIVKHVQKWQSGDNLNDDIKIDNEFSVVADPFAYENFHAMKYVKWMGAPWKIVKIDVQRPRIRLTIGGVYNGETAPAPDDT